MNPELNTNYPPPEIPSDEAWAKMKSLLDAELPAGEPPAKGNMGGSGGGFRKIAYLISGGVLLVIVGLIVFTGDFFKTDEVAEETVEIVSIESTNEIVEKPEMIAAEANLEELSVNEKQAENHDILHSKNEAAGQKQNGKAAGSNEELTPKPTTGTTSDNSDKETPLKENKQQFDYNSVSLAEGKIINPEVSEQVAQEQEKEKETGLMVLEKQANEDDIIQTKEDQSTSTVNKQLTAPGGNANPLLNTESSEENVQKKSGFFSKTHFGVQWNLPIPVQGTDYYFAGYNGKSEPYLYLIPGVWSTYDAGKSEIMLQVTPCSPTFTGEKTLTSSLVQDSLLSDSLQNGYATTTYLYKTFGLGLRLQYNFEISRSFSIGAGINYTILFKALEKTVTMNGQAESDSLFGVKKAWSNWNYIQPGYLSANIEAAWRIKKIDLGVNFSLPLTNLYHNGNEKIIPLNAQVFIRWRIR